MTVRRMMQHCAGQEGITMGRSGEWLFCPKCQKRTRVKVYENTVMVHFPLYCHWCKTEFIIVYVAGKVTVEKKAERNE